MKKNIPNKTFQFLKLISLLILFFGFKANAQKEVWKSDVIFYEDSLNDFYSSIAVDSTQIYFIANDYYVHAIDKKTGKTIWNYYLANKTNNSPKIFKNNILVGKHISEYSNQCIQLNSKTGDTVQTLLISKIETEPLFKNDVMYCTALNDGVGGVIMAYNLAENKIDWQQFIAHGVSTQPHFLKDKIVANAEADNWFEIGYDGVLKDTTCTYKATMFVESIPCVNNYEVLTPDEIQLNSDFLTSNLGEYENFNQKVGEKITVLMSDENLLIIGRNKKILQKINLSEISSIPKFEPNGYKDLIKIEDDFIWFFYQNQLFSYNYKINTMDKIYDVSKWKAHQLVLEIDNSMAWIISKNDAQLYGIQLNNK